MDVNEELKFCKNSIKKIWGGGGGGWGVVEAGVGLRVGGSEWM